MLNFAESFRGKAPEPPAPGVAPSGKNRAQRRYEKRQRESHQRRGQKAFTRDQLSENRQRLEAQRELTRSGEARFVRWGRDTVFVLAGTALFEGKRIPVIAAHPEGYETHYFDDRFGKATKAILAPDSVPSIQPIELDDEDSFKSRPFGGGKK
jgi:hypothetical protein